MADVKKELNTQREVVREHLRKYDIARDEGERKYAADTIRRVQAEIEKILKRHPHLERRPEDTLSPSRGFSSPTYSGG